MTFLSNIRHDAALRNLTIYAQWFGIATAIMAFYVEITENRLYSVQGWKHRSSWRITAEIFKLMYASFLQESTANVDRKLTKSFSFYPLCPLVMEMPYLFKYIPICHYVLVPWWMALGSRWRDRIVSNWARVGFYLTYTIVSSQYVGRPMYRILKPLPISVPVWRFNVAVAFSFITASLYLLAYILRHKYVFGRTLGGSGVEPMDLTLPGSGPQYPAVSQEGRIRLN